MWGLYIPTIRKKKRDASRESKKQKHMTEDSRRFRLFPFCCLLSLSLFFEIAFVHVGLVCSLHMHTLIYPPPLQLLLLL